MLPVEARRLVPEVGDLRQAVSDEDAERVDQCKDEPGPYAAGPHGDVGSAPVARRGAIRNLRFPWELVIRHRQNHAIAPLLK